MDENKNYNTDKNRRQKKQDRPQEEEWNESNAKKKVK